MVNVLLFGLDERTAGKIGQALRASAASSGSLREFDPVSPEATTVDTARALRSRPDLVFCSADSKHYRPLLREIAQTRRHVPVVIVSEEPEFRAYADAMDRGAADFYHGPVEASRIRSLVFDYVDALPVVA
jgi:DNA-binding NtrC family response regulator